MSIGFVICCLILIILVLCAVLCSCACKIVDLEVALGLAEGHADNRDDHLSNEVLILALREEALALQIQRSIDQHPSNGRGADVLRFPGGAS